MYIPYLLVPTSWFMLACMGASSLFFGRPEPCPALNRTNCDSIVSCQLHSWEGLSHAHLDPM